MLNAGSLAHTPSCNNSEIALHQKASSTLAMIPFPFRLHDTLPSYSAAATTFDPYRFPHRRHSSVASAMRQCRNSIRSPLVVDNRENRFWRSPGARPSNQPPPNGRLINLKYPQSPIAVKRKRNLLCLPVGRTGERPDSILFHNRKISQSPLSGASPEGSKVKQTRILRMRTSRRSNYSNSTLKTVWGQVSTQGVTT